MCPAPSCPSPTARRWINDSCRVDARKALVKLDVWAIKMPRKRLPFCALSFCSRQRCL